MKALLRGCFVLMTSLALATGCGDGGDFGTDPGTQAGTDLARMAAAPAPVCERLCEARRALACPRDAGDCMRVCTEATAGGCGSQWTSYFTCFVDSAPGQRVCSAVGQADLTPGVCAGEHGDVQRCLIAALSGS